MSLAVHVVLASLAFSLVTSAPEKSRRLNGVLALEELNEVQWFAATPDGARAVYSTRIWLFSTPVDGSAPPLRLTFGGPVPHDVPLLSPDSSRVVYLGGPNSSNRDDLVSVPVAGGALVVLNDALVPGGAIEVGSARITADSSRVVYVADALVAGEHELFSAAITGAGPSIALSAFGGNNDVVRVEVAPVGDRAVFAVQTNFTGRRQLYSVPADGSAPPVRLDSPAGGHEIPDFAISPDGGRVVYLADQDQLGVPELYSAPIDGSLAAVKLNPAPVAGGAVLQPFEISADSSRVVYRADQDVDGEVELWSVPLAGGVAVQLNGALAPGGEVVAASISPDSARVVYLADQATDEELELFGVPIAGGTAVRLSGALVAGGDVRAGFRFSPDGARVVYRADRDADETIELYSVPTSGAAPPVELSGALVAGGDVESPDGIADPVRIDAGGTHVAYLADALVDGRFELFSAPLAGGSAPLRISAPAPHEHDVVELELAGPRALYRGDPTTNEALELRSVPLDGSAPALRISERVAFGPTAGDVRQFAVVPGGEHVAYVANEESADRHDLLLVPSAGGESVRLSDGVGSVGLLSLARDGSRALYSSFARDELHLFSVALDGGTPPVQLDPGSGGEEPVGWRIHPSSAWVVYRVQAPSAGIQLYSVPIDGGARVLLSSPALPNADVLDFELHPHAALAAFRADRAVDQQLELYLAGGGPVGKVNGPMVAGGDVEDYAFSWNGGVLVYRADQELDGRTELYAAGTSPLSAPVKLSGPLVAGGDVHAFELATSSPRVVYTADQELDGRVELYTNALDGSPALKLNGPLVAGGNVDLFLLAPDGSRVVYRADQLADTVRDLFSVSVLGGTPALLNAHGPDVDVQRFAVSHDSRWVVYTADELGADAFRLYAAPLDGSAPGRELSAPLDAFEDVAEFWIDPASELVLYRANHRDFVWELYVAPLDGSKPARRVNDPLPSGCEVFADLEFAGERVVYRADLLAPGIVELFSTGLRRDVAAGTLDGSAVR